MTSRTYNIVITLAVGEHADDLQTEQAIRNEITAWLEGLGAEIRKIDIKEGE